MLSKQIALRPENVTVLSGIQGDGIRGVVRTIMMLGHYLEMTLDTSQGLVKAYITAEEATRFSVGSEVTLRLNHIYEYEKEDA